MRKNDSSLEIKARDFWKQETFLHGEACKMDGDLCIWLLGAVQRSPLVRDQGRRLLRVQVEYHAGHASTD